MSTAVEFPPDWDDEKKQQYFDLVAKQASERSPKATLIQLKPEDQRVREAHARAKEDLKKWAGAKTKALTMVPPPDALTIIPSEFSSGRNAHAPNLSNTITALRSLAEYRYNRFADKFLVGGHEMAGQVGESIDNACSILRTAIIAQSGFEPSAAMVAAGVQRLCLQNSFDPVLDYLDGLKWDGTSRLDTWLIKYLSAADTRLNRAIGRKVLIAGVRRVRQPGVKFDEIAILEGPQGTGKSSAIRILAGPYFSDAEILPAAGKERQELVNGVWLYEISELAGLHKSEIERVKAFASYTHDRARPAWGRTVVDRPRRCIFIGTTNDDKYLQDPTGNRRFWPVLTGDIKLETLTRDRDQLWAEAASAEKTEIELTIERDLWDAAKAEAAERLLDDPWEDILANVPNLISQSSGSIVIVEGQLRVFSSYLLQTVLHIDPAHAKLFDSKRLGTCMRKLGWTGPATFRIGCKPGKGYWKPME